LGKRKIVVTVCGGFDPIHVGHIRHFEGAKALGDELVVILNSDAWLRKKKGYVFMRWKERKEIIESIKFVDRVIPYIETPDGSVARTLEKLKPDILTKGGDRTPENMPKAEMSICRKLSIKLIYGVGGKKAQSSSWLVEKMTKGNNLNISA